MRAIALFCFAAVLAVAVALPPPVASVAPMIPSAAMIQAFIPTPEEMATLNTLHTTPAPRVVPTPALATITPPSMLPAIANLIAKYKAAAAAFIPSTVAPTA